MLNQDEKKRLEMKIAALENLTSAEFKIIICQRAWMGIKRKAQYLFKKYHLDKTENRNAVLLLVVEKDKELLVYGDVGVCEETVSDHWLKVRTTVLKAFKNDAYYVGLSSGLEMIADNLSEQFPAPNNNNNEVNNEVIYL